MSYERLETRKWCHAKLCEKADPLKALGCVASFLRNGKFYLINDNPMCCSFLKKDATNACADGEILQRLSCPSL